MTHDEIIKQLESLLSHCKSMIEKNGGFPIWEKDCEALEAAIAALRPSGEPLTLEQLREMDGQPVWLHTFSSKSKKTNIEQWALVASFGEYSVSFVRVAVSGRLEKRCSDYGKTWLAYAYPPIDREKWTAEWKDFRGKPKCSKCNSVFPEEYFNWPFCPKCGRAMTPETWAELGKRLRSVNHG